MRRRYVTRTRHWLFLLLCLPVLAMLLGPATYRPAEQPDESQSAGPAPDDKRLLPRARTIGRWHRLDEVDDASGIVTHRVYSDRFGEPYLLAAERHRFRFECTSEEPALTLSIDKRATSGFSVDQDPVIELQVDDHPSFALETPLAVRVDPVPDHFSHVLASFSNGASAVVRIISSTLKGDTTIRDFTIYLRGFDQQIEALSRHCRMPPPVPTETELADAVEAIQTGMRERLQAHFAMSIDRPVQCRFRVEPDLQQLRAGRVVDSFVVPERCRAGGVSIERIGSHRDDLRADWISASSAFGSYLRTFQHPALTLDVTLHPRSSEAL